MLKFSEIAPSNSPVGDGCTRMEPRQNFQETSAFELTEGQSDEVQSDTETDVAPSPSHVRREARVRELKLTQDRNAANAVLVKPRSLKSKPAENINIMKKTLEASLAETNVRYSHFIKITHETEIILIFQ